MARAPAEADKPARLVVRLTPRGGRDAIDGWTRDADGAPCLKVRVSAPPVEARRTRRWKSSSPAR